MEIRAAIVGGTGIGSRLAAMPGCAFARPTSAGLLRGRLIDVRGGVVLAVQRHQAGHRVPPHRVNYAALALGLAALRVPVCFSTAAVGSLRPDWGPGRFAVCSDLYDATSRRATLHDRDVRHADLMEPFEPSARKALLDAASGEAHDGAVYVCSDGPRYESPAEIHALRTLGGDVVGMTAGTEAILLREAGVPYACLAVVTNFASGLEAGTLDHGDVEQAMYASGARALEILLAAVQAWAA